MAQLVAAGLSGVLGTSGIPAAETQDASAPRPASADSTAGYWLLDPLPERLLGPMYTDRPTIAFTPYTVGPGHVQIETALALYLKDDEGGRETEQWRFGDGELRVGVLKDFEVQIAGTAYVVAEVEEPGGDEERDEFGALTLRAKYTVWGSAPLRRAGEEPKVETAFAVLPFIDLPVGDDTTAAGALFPFYSPLPAKFALTVQPGVTVTEPFEDGGDLLLSTAIALARPIVGPLTAFVEFAGVVDPEEPDDWSGSVNNGLIYNLSQDVQLHLAGITGLTEEAPDLRVFVGLAHRF